MSSHFWAGLAAAGATVAVATGCSVGRHGVQSNSVHVTINGVDVSSARKGNEVKDSVQKRFIADKVATIKLDNQSGSIEIHSAPAGQNEVHIEAIKSIQGADSVDKLKPLLASVTVSAALQGTDLVVTSTYPPNFNQRKISVAVNYVITAPERLTFDLRTSSGAINLRGVRGGGTVHTEYGSIEVRAGAGKLDLSTSSGSVKVLDSPDVTSVNAKTDFGDIEIRRVSGRIEADTNSGAVIATDLGSATSITLHSDYGKVSLTNVAGSIDASSDSGEVEVTDARVTDSLTLKSQYGAVQATSITATSATLKVDLQTQSGAAVFDGDVTDLIVKSEYGAVTAVVAGKRALRTADMHSSSGSVELTLPSTASATVAASTSSGHIDVPGGLASPSSNEEGTKQTVIVGGGNAKVKLSTDFGDAVLKTR